jgi:hypothetical protein
VWGVGVGVSWGKWIILTHYSGCKTTILWINFQGFRKFLYWL